MCVLHPHPHATKDVFKKKALPPIVKSRLRFLSRNFRIINEESVGTFSIWFVFLPLSLSLSLSPSLSLCDMSRLFSPLSLSAVSGVLTLQNRIVIAPMCQYSADSGCATDWHLFHWTNLLNSGAGLVILEATAVTPEGRITPDCLGLWDDKTEESLREMLSRAKRLSPPNVKVFLQLAHAGRKASTASPWKGGRYLSLDEGGWQSDAPSPIPFAADQTVVPHALSEDEIQKVVTAFANAAERAERIGLDGIEIHGAHGYLIHEFLSPLSNQRSDKYGGSFENRVRFACEVFTAIRSKFQRPIGIRLSATDWVDGGWTSEETAELAVLMKGMGCAYVHVSSGGLSHLQQIPARPHYQVPFAKLVKERSHIPTIAVGLITDPLKAEKILEDEEADCVALARGVLFNPRWGWTAAAALNGRVEASPQYWRCPPHGSGHIFTHP
jgi:2,4-dienoyl-CoA reductase-like NADH-dependent reductase (Old Yellow Enzyme family)